MHIKTKAAIIWRLTFSITLLSLFVACEDPGTIGSGFVDKTEINVDTILVTNLTVQNEDAYFGRLNRTPIGVFNDQLYGNIESASFFKPSITRNSTTFVLDTDSTRFQLKLRLLEGEIYGDTSSTSSYSIYRVNTPWRGSTFRNSMDIGYNNAELIGEFTDADVDTTGYTAVDLTGTWKDDYINFFNLSDSIRAEEYRVGDYGLVIVPDVTNTKLVYVNYSVSSISVIQEDKADTTAISMLDWAADTDITGGVVDSEKIILQSTYNTILSLNLAEIADQISNVNFVKAELIFKEDTLDATNLIGENEVRTGSLGLGIKVGPEDDIAFELGFGSIDISAISVNGTYTFSITNLLNNYIYGEATITDLYIYLASNQGALGFTRLYNSSSALENAPKLILYGLEGVN